MTSVVARSEPSTGGARAVLAYHGRTFNYAAHFLSPEHLHRSARLYSFCRHIDDLADEGDGGRVAQGHLASVLKALKNGNSTQPAVSDFFALSDEVGIDPALPAHLIRGVRRDLEPVALATQCELLDYAYHVAGVVGLMMCSALEVSDTRALPHAIDLGIAMQLTNIARDVQEDAARDRRYLPGEWVDGLPPAELYAPAGRERQLIIDAVHRLLALADRYYRSGEAGLVYLPFRAGYAINVAARAYRRIGTRLLASGCPLWSGRMVVSSREKARIAMVTVPRYLARRMVLRRPVHDPSLHAAIVAYPGTNAVQGGIHASTQRAM